VAIENSSRDVYVRLFHKLREVVPDLMGIEESGKSIVEGYMDLNLDVIHKRSSCIVIALSHYYEHPSGDMIPDPDMEIAVYPDKEMAEALSYQDGFCYRRVYDHNNTTEDIKAKSELNVFLEQWLVNLIEQGHSIREQGEGGAHD